MFNVDPTLYGATIPHRELPFMNPYLAQWQNQQTPWPTFGQQVPWSAYQKFMPPTLPPTLPPEFMPPMQQFPGNRFFGQIPYPPFGQNIYNVPQYKWQMPYAY